MAKRKQRKSRARRKPAPLPAFGGDHGTGTTAATNGTVVVALTNEDGSNPNNMARRERVSAINGLKLTMRQEQAAREIEIAWCKMEALQSGGPLKERVDASPKPDAVIDRQVDAQARWLRATAAIPRHDRALVHWVCCLNRPITQWRRATGEARAKARFEGALDKVADWLRY